MSVSEPERKKRRQFLADALFAGGSLAAAALLARSFSSAPVVAQAPVPSSTPSSTPTSCPPTPDGPYPGEMVQEPQIEGKFVVPAPAPEPRAKGNVAPNPRPESGPGS